MRGAGGFPGSGRIKGHPEASGGIKGHREAWTRNKMLLSGIVWFGVSGRNHLVLHAWICIANYGFGSLLALL